MYRTYLQKTLPMTELKACNRAAPSGIKYCNGFCQELREKTDFSGTKMICNRCRNLLNLGKKQIKTGTITLEQFKENPDIVYGVDGVIITEKTCKTCKETKPILEFDSNKKECKACRLIRTNTRNKDIETYIQDINTLKENLHKLKSFVEKIPKNKLIKVISHFKVGRKATDTKAVMVSNAVEHFRCLLNPMLCQGGCGYTLQEEFKTCDNCKKKKARTKRSLEDFKNSVLPEFLDNLKIIEKHQTYLYNKAESMLIAKGLGLSPKQSNKKHEVIEMINIEIERRKQESDDIVITESDSEDEGHQTLLELNGIVISSREDGFVNATQMCKAGGKLFGHWKPLESTKALIKALESDIGIPASQLVDVRKGNSSKFSQGSWVHPDLAVQLAQWISPVFALQVSRWVRELAVTGRVKMGREKSHTQIIELQKKLGEEQQQRKMIENKHKNMLYRRSYHKFKKGRAFYVISDTDSNVTKYKVGIDDIDINVRLAQHRTSLPALRLEYLIYTNKNSLLEEAMLERYDEHRRPFQNHEWIYDMTLEHILQSIKTLVNFLGIDYTVDQDLSQYNKI
jgi:hypothetical protein